MKKSAEIKEQLAIRVAGGTQLKLTRFFAIVSMLCIVIITAVSGVFLTRFLEQNLLQRDAIVLMQFVQSVARSIQSQGYFIGDDSTRTREALTSFFEQVAHIPDIRRANIYGTDGTVLWSTEPSLVGRRFIDNDELESALRGELIIKTGHVGDEGKTEHAGLTPMAAGFVENYIPIRTGNAGPIMGVAEIYREPHAMLETVRRGDQLVWISGIAGGVFLFSVLFWIVLRAQRQIERQQESLIESERMSAVGEMAAAVAHGVRNPLAGIRSTAELLRMGSDQGSHERADQIISDVDRLVDWIRDLLAFVGGQPVANTGFEVNELVQRCLELQRRRLEEQGIRLTISNTAPASQIAAPKELIEQALNSLVSNAVEAMPEGGDLTIVTARANGSVTIEIRDSGAGISRDKLQELFTPMVTHKGKGLGMGLFLARRIVQRFGGSLTLSSHEGAGTSARMVLPAQQR